jgi:hypothetical protein
VEQGNKENNIDQKPISIAHLVHQVKAVPPALMVPIIDVVILKKLNTQIEKDVPRYLRLLLTKKRKKLQKKKGSSFKLFMPCLGCNLRNWIFIN